LRHNTANRAVPQHGPAPLDLESSSQHRRQHAIGRPVSVQEGLDIDDHLLAHVDTAFECGRAHVRQQYDLAYACELDQLRIDGRLVLETSRPAPAISPEAIRRTSAFSSITSPRAVLTI